MQLHQHLLVIQFYQVYHIPKNRIGQKDWNLQNCYDKSHETPRTLQAAYKQKFDTAVSLSDLNLFVTTVISLILNSEDYQILWKNRTQKSVRFSKPLKVEYVKESTEHILKEKHDIDGNIDKLETLTILCLTIRKFK